MLGNPNSLQDVVDQDKFAGLYDRKGRNLTFSDSQQEQIKQWVKQNPRNLKRVVAKAAATFGKSVSQKDDTTSR